MKSSIRYTKLGKEFGYLLSSSKSEWIQTIILQLKHHYIQVNISFVLHYQIYSRKIINTIVLSTKAPSKCVQINDYFSYYLLFLCNAYIAFVCCQFRDKLVKSTYFQMKTFFCVYEGISQFKCFFLFKRKNQLNCHFSMFHLKRLYVRNLPVSYFKFFIHFKNANSIYYTNGTGKNPIRTRSKI